jgi:hypothetical protein
VDVPPVVAVAAGALGFFPFLLAYLGGRGAQAVPTTTTVGTNTSNPTCDQARADFEKRRQERCKAKLDEAAAKAELDNRNSDFYSATAALVSATVAAFASIALPWPANLIVGLILWTIVTVMLALMMYFLGKKMVASDAWTAAAKVLKAANDAVMEARTAITDHCPPDIAAAAFALPDPCP